MSFATLKFCHRDGKSQDDLLIEICWFPRRLPRDAKMEHVELYRSIRVPKAKLSILLLDMSSTHTHIYIYIYIYIYICIYIYQTINTHNNQNIQIPIFRSKATHLKPPIITNQSTNHARPPAERLGRS
jgi:hypothetical protein